MDDIERSIREKAKEVVESHEKSKENFEFKLDRTKSFEEQAKDLVGVKATKQAIEDDELTRSVTDRKKAEILNHADAHRKKEEAENKKADTILQEANYGVYEGVATYAGIKKALPQKMQNVLFPILGIVQIILLLLFGIPTSFICIIMDEVESVITKLGTLAKASRRIVLAALGLAVLGVGYIIVKFFLQKAGIIS